MIDLLELADKLDACYRFGKTEDTNEGERWIQISDTLARQIAKDLREYDELTDEHNFSYKD